MSNFLQDGSNFGHQQEKIRQGWSLLSTLHCLLLSGKLVEKGSKTFKKPNVEQLAIRYNNNYFSKSCSPDSTTQIFLCLVTLELWLPDNYSFVVFLLGQKTNLTIFIRNCFTKVLRILITIIPAAFLNRHKNIHVRYGQVVHLSPSLTVQDIGLK